MVSAATAGKRQYSLELIGLTVQYVTLVHWITIWRWASDSGQSVLLSVRTGPALSQQRSVCFRNLLYALVASTDDDSEE